MPTPLTRQKDGLTLYGFDTDPQMEPFKDKRLIKNKDSKVYQVVTYSSPHE